MNQFISGASRNKVDTNKSWFAVPDYEVLPKIYFKTTSYMWIIICNCHFSQCVTLQVGKLY